MEARYSIGSAVSCSDGVCGTLTRVIVNPVNRTLTHLVVEPDGDAGEARLVPVELVDPEAPAEAIALNCDGATFEKLEYAQFDEFVPAKDDALGYSAHDTLLLPFYPLAGVAVSAGAPGRFGPGPVAAAFPDDAPRVIHEDRVPDGEVQVRRGQPVHAADGDIGRVRGLVVDPVSEHITHVLLDEGHLWGKKTVGIPIGAVQSVRDGIHLELTKNDVRDLPEIELGHDGVL